MGVIPPFSGYFIAVNIVIRCLDNTRTLITAKAEHVDSDSGEVKATLQLSAFVTWPLLTVISDNEPKSVMAELTFLVLKCHLKSPKIIHFPSVTAVSPTTVSFFHLFLHVTVAKRHLDFTLSLNMHNA